MRIQELRELSFKSSYLPLGYPTFFLCVFLSHRSFSFRLPHQGRDSEMQGFFGKNTTRRAGDFSRKTGGLTLHFRQIPELPLQPNENDHLMRRLEVAKWR